MRSDGAALREVAWVFAKLGTIGFGGPAAHVAMMQDEVVRRRGWVTQERFLDLLGATNLIPGPNSTEMAIHLGRVRAGWGGLIVGGACFIAPAMLIVGALAWAYTRYGALPQVHGLLYGVKAVIIAIVAQALLKLGRTAVKSAALLLIGGAAVAGILAGVNELLVLLLSGLAALLLNRRTPRIAEGALGAAPLLLLTQVAAGQTGGGAALSLSALFWLFAKIGAVLFGSGYVLLAFLRADFVERRGWLSEQQLLDAIAVGQVTPGPLFTTATFIGYVLAGPGGALAATVGIFLPAFVFVALSGPLVPRLRQSAAAGAFLDGVNVGALALMAVVAVQLARAALVDAWAVLLAVGAAAALWRYGLNSAWLVLGGAAAGLLRSAGA